MASFYKIIRKPFRRVFQNLYRNLTHGELIEKLIFENAELIPNGAVFIETGCGVSTVSLAKAGARVGATIYSLDYNPEKIEALKKRSGDAVKNVNFISGDSLESLLKITTDLETINFLFLDSAASAMHTFREFQICERLLKHGSILLADNSGIPGHKPNLTAVRKGKILVPYLLSSPVWDVKPFPRAGDSCVAAIYRSEGNFADPDYEDIDHVDPWQSFFDNKLS